MEKKLTPPEFVAKAKALMDPIRALNLSDSDRALVHLVDALTSVLIEPAAAAPAPAAASTPAPLAL